MKTNMSLRVNRTKLQIKKHSPELLIGAGIVGFVGTIVLACRATVRAEDILNKHKAAMDDAKEAEEMAEPEDGYDIRKEKAIIYAHTALNFGKLYAPTIATGCATLACFLKAYNIANTRYIGAVAAYNAVSAAFNDYRSRVKNECGEDVDQHFMYGGDRTTVDSTTIDENGKTKKFKEEVEDITIDGHSQYAVLFDRRCPEWDANALYNYKWLRANETAANDILKTRGHIFLNEVYDMIGLPHTPAGAVVGWINDGNGDNFVDFGLYDPSNESAKRFINGEDNVVLLDFNVDGIIFDKI